MKIVFMGTPEFAAVSLRHLLGWTGGEVAAVYCQPDRPAGRGKKLQSGPVKALALERGLPVLQPQNFKDPAELDKLAAFGADLIAVAAYGLILPTALLRMPPLGVINVHGSLLPEYRGAAPIQRAVMEGRVRTGITIMRVEPKLDSGPILLQRALGIGWEQSAGELHDELAELGGALLVEALERMREGRLQELVQDESRVTYAHKLSKADGLLDFRQSAAQVHNQARGVTPWPGAQLNLRRQAADGAQLPPLPVLVLKGRPFAKGEEPESATQAPGALLPLKDGMLPLLCGQGVYGIEQLRPSGGKSMDAAAFANGYLKDCRAWAE
ncbi:methionyl-tRNA formyltransferase [Desulfovibrio sp. OttesenSCG-928-C14]|nr:methionyl-tRNA formyltransferase [Desulfovibrio sp. OttesenSCG-928-C14]